MSQVLRYMATHSAEPQTVVALARMAKLSPYHFLRAFRGAAGTTPHQYLLASRLRRAARLLLTGVLPVTDVAMEAGFGDLSNFIRTFRRAAGCSPRAFRLRGTQGRAPARRLG